MTKSDLIEKVAKDTGLEKNKIGRVIDSVMNNIKTSLTKDENVYLRGFGSFIIKERAQKTARDIRKGTTIIVPPCKVPAFKPSKDFKL